MALVLSGVMFWLYTQQLTCDAHAQGCLVNLSVHPEDRFFTPYDPGKPRDEIVLVGHDSLAVANVPDPVRNSLVTHNKFPSGKEIVEATCAAVVGLAVGTR